ncbi:MATE family efflux transporter [Burkholderia plantarii]|uniref:Na+-driven multidrug efflux pump n=1 Tax=Burkholderia plantarii TaxID=41899 RepID=A0A0B6RXR8_BURPL|nr:MATE family efflux transporter [Burkholderia plantarii]AJK45830.1 Na+-driven multidrug efflux pump [Burkholderia plantarii]
MSAPSALSAGVAPGRAGVGHRRVLGLAVPIVLANLTQPILGAVDTAVAGHLDGTQMLGGVALGSLFFGFVYWGFGFLRMGTTGLVAQAFGAGDHAGIRLNVLRALVLAGLLGFAVLALHGPLISIALTLLGGSEAVRATARDYVLARIWAAPFALANYAILGYLLGVQRVRLALALQAFINLVNIVAVLLFVYRLGGGVAGIGAATAAADLAGFGFGVLALIRRRHRGLGRPTWGQLLDRAALKRLVALNRDIFVRTLCLLSAFGWFAHLGARQGDAMLAANALLLNFQAFMAYALDGFAHAAEALVGAAAGARDRAVFRATLRVTLQWAAGCALAFSAVYALGGDWIIARLSDQPAIRAAAGHFLPWAAVMPLVSVWGFLLDGVFIGATRTRGLMMAMAVSLGVFVAATFVLTGPLGNHGLWLAMAIFMIARGVTLASQVPALSRHIGGEAS